jgi:hypothetical protein
MQWGFDRAVHLCFGKMGNHPFPLAANVSDLPTTACRLKQVQYGEAAKRLASQQIELEGKWKR